MKQILAPQSAYFYFLQQQIKALKQQESLIYIAKNEKTLQNILFNITFCLNDTIAKKPLAYLHENDDKIEGCIEVFNPIFAKSIANLQLFLDGGFSPLLFTTQKSVCSNIEAFTSPLCPVNNLTYEQIITKLIECGYERVSCAENEGEFSVRGQIIDLIKPKSELDIFNDKFLSPHEGQGPLGYRLQFFGEKIEECFAFNTGDQLRKEKYPAQTLQTLYLQPIKMQSQGQFFSLLTTPVQIICEPFFHENAPIIPTNHLVYHLASHLTPQFAEVGEVELPNVALI